MERLSNLSKFTKLVRTETLSNLPKITKLVSTGDAWVAQSVK